MHCIQAISFFFLRTSFRKHGCLRQDQWVQRFWLTPFKSEFKTSTTDLFSKHISKEAAPILNRNKTFLPVQDCPILQLYAMEKHGDTLQTYLTQIHI